MRARAVPISASPYLSSLRGGARFVEGGAPRIQRDKAGFEALVAAVDYLRALSKDDATAYLRYLLRCFVRLRDAGNIPLRRVERPNLDHLQRLIEGLLAVKSGGRLPPLLATAMFQTISECHDLGWEVEFQGINVADKFTDAVGDITVRKSGEIILGVEVTERQVDGGRVTLVFDQKVSPGRLEDYLFISTVPPAGTALAVARSYTAVGHEMNFVPLLPWLIHNLATLGVRCRTLFQSKMLALIETQSADLKVAWNNQMGATLNAPDPV